MSFRSRQTPHDRSDGAEDDLDRLLSWGVQQMARPGEPPPHVWEGIRSRLQGGPSPVRHRSRRVAARSAPLAQVLALASLLVVLGLSLGPVLQWPSYLISNGEQIKALTRTPEMQVEPAGPPLDTEEGLLSGREILLWEREAARQQQVMAHDTAPSVDPILTYRQEWRKRSASR